MDVEAIRSAWAVHQAELQRFLDELTPEQLGRKISYVNFQGQPFAYPMSVARYLPNVAGNPFEHRDRAWGSEAFARYSARCATVAPSPPSRASATSKRSIKRVRAR